MIADSDLSRDAFLGGRLHLWQPKKGYRAGVDPVLLAAATPAQPGESVLDLGCGTGAAMLCLGKRVSGLRLVGVERNPDHAELALRNAEDNALAAEIVLCDVAELPASLRQHSFDHVIANPPYFRGGTPASTRSRAEAMTEDTPLSIWLQVAYQRLTPEGRLTFVLRADRMAEALAALDPRMGGVTLLPIAPRHNREASLILLTARKATRAGSRLLAPLILHHGPAHESDSEDYSAAAIAILREMAPLNL